MLANTRAVVNINRVLIATNMHKVFSDHCTIKDKYCMVAKKYWMVAVEGYIGTQ